MGGLSRLPFGPALINLLGHMRAPRELEKNLMGIRFPASVGLGPYLDVELKALRAFSRFGFGFMEIGPVMTQPFAPAPVARVEHQQAIVFEGSGTGLGLTQVESALRETGPLHQPLFIRIGGLPEEPAEVREVIDRLSKYAAAFTLAPNSLLTNDPEDFRLIRKQLQEAYEYCRTTAPQCRLLLCLRAAPDFIEVSLQLSRLAVEIGFDGLLIDGAIRNGDNEIAVGPPAREAALELIRALRSDLGPEICIIGSGGIHEPADAIEFLNAGANLFQTDSGLVYSGPGLPKRINEALLFNEVKENIALGRAVEQTWLWTLLMGIGMLIGSLIAILIAATRIVLKYDEQFVGLDRTQLRAINDRLLLFMAHDRVSLAGTMITIGVLYIGLSLGGVRRGLHWARQSILYSAFAGFLSFFLFLGFGYFDPFHAFVTSILFQFLLLALYSRLCPVHQLPVPNLRESRQWWWNQWGQFMFVMHGAGLLLAGLAISAVGITQVFVQEDLEFMRTTAEALHHANHNLVPLIAHDRATFGGMLISSGIGVLLPSLWGFKQGERWLWWTFALAGFPAYLAAIGVHLAVGYINWWHLAPVFIALGFYSVGLACSYGYLCAPQVEASQAFSGRRLTAGIDIREVLKPE
jgi:dihydroorotate dehydrogenase